MTNASSELVSEESSSPFVSLPATTSISSATAGLLLPTIVLDKDLASARGFGSQRFWGIPKPGAHHRCFPRFFPLSRSARGAICKDCGGARYFQKFRTGSPDIPCEYDSDSYLVQFLGRSLNEVSIQARILERVLRFSVMRFGRPVSGEAACPSIVQDSVSTASQNYCEDL